MAARIGGSTGGWLKFGATRVVDLKFGDYCLPCDNLENLKTEKAMLRRQPY